MTTSASLSLAAPKSLPGDLEEELTARAVRAYFRRFGEYADQPSAALSTYDGGCIVLSNTSGELARFKVLLSDSGLAAHLRFIPREPSC